MEAQKTEVITDPPCWTVGAWTHRKALGGALNEQNQQGTGLPQRGPCTSGLQARGHGPRVPGGACTAPTLFPLPQPRLHQGMSATGAGTAGPRDRATRPRVPVTTLGHCFTRQGSSTADPGVSVPTAKADQPPPPGPDAKAGGPCPGKAQPASPGRERGKRTDELGKGGASASRARRSHDMGPGVPSTRLALPTPERPSWAQSSRPV